MLYMGLDLSVQAGIRTLFPPKILVGFMVGELDMLNSGGIYNIFHGTNRSGLILVGTAGIGHFYMRRAPANRVTVYTKYRYTKAERNAMGKAVGTQEAEAVTTRLQTNGSKEKMLRQGNDADNRWQCTTKATSFTA